MPEVEGMNTDLFKLVSMGMVVFQIIFHAKIYINDVFFIFKK